MCHDHSHPPPADRKRRRSQPCHTGGPLDPARPDARDINIDFATYNPVSLVLKANGWLEEEFAPDGTTVTWAKSAGSNKALEFLNASALDFGSTAGAAALVGKINGNRSSRSTVSPNPNGPLS